MGCGRFRVPGGGDLIGFPADGATGALSNVKVVNIFVVDFLLIGTPQLSNSPE